MEPSTQKIVEENAKEQNKRTLNNIFFGLGVLLVLAILAEIFVL